MGTPKWPSYNNQILCVSNIYIDAINYDLFNDYNKENKISYLIL